MRNAILRTASKSSLLILAALLLTASAQSQEKAARNTWKWNNSENGRRIEVTIENKVEFNDDYSDVAAIPGDGALRIYDSRGSRAIRLAITRGSTGELRRDYSIDGQTRSFDAEGQTWLRAVLMQAVREGGLDASDRAARILKQQGTRGLVEEIGYLKGDYVRRIYFAVLLSAPRVSPQDLESALRNASNTIKGDYERAQLLLQVANVFLVNQNLLPAYFDAVNKIAAPYEHARVLGGALKREALSKEALSAIAQSAATVDSDYEKANVLVMGAERYQASLSLRMDWLHAARTIASDHEHHRALSGALKPSEISVEALSDLVQSAARIQSDYEKASFLIEALGHYRSDARLRAAFLETARTIGSEYERGRVQKRLEKAISEVEGKSS
jgi:hypothetical protein